MSKVVTIHGHTLELDMGPSCTNPGIRRQLDAKGEPYNRSGDLHVTDGDMPERAGSGWQGMTISGLLPQMMYLKTVLFQLLRLIKAHYNLRLMNS